MDELFKQDFLKFKRRNYQNRNNMSASRYKEALTKGNEYLDQYLENCRNDESSILPEKDRELLTELSNLIKYELSLIEKEKKDEEEGE